MDFATAVRTCFQKYVTFDGRARRAEFWYFWLFLVIAHAVASVLDSIAGTGGALEGLLSLVTFLPQIAVTARRLHDTGHSGWWQVAYIIPMLVMAFALLTGAPLLSMLASLAVLATFIAVLIWLVRAGDRGPNRFGPDPLGPPVMVRPV